MVGEEGVWSGGLRRLKGGAFRPERKTSSSPRRVRRRGSRAGAEVGGSGVRRRASFAFALFQTVALAVHLQDVDMVGEAVQQRAGQPF